MTDLEYWRLRIAVDILDKERIMPSEDVRMYTAWIDEARARERCPVCGADRPRIEAERGVCFATKGEGYCTPKALHVLEREKRHPHVTKENQ